VREWATSRLWVVTVLGRQTEGGFCLSLAAEAKRAARIQAAADVPILPHSTDLYLVYLTPIDDDAESCRAFYHEVAHCFRRHHEPGARHPALPWVYGPEVEADRSADAWLRASGLYGDDGAPVAEPSAQP
jgi:hypothetical protein